MTEAYGRAFTSQFGTEPLASWAAGLSEFSDDEIRDGYVRALQDNREFVPNLSILLSYVRNPVDWEHARQARPAADVLLDKPVDLGEGRHLPAPTDDRTPGEHLAAMKALLAE